MDPEEKEPDRESDSKSDSKSDCAFYRILPQSSSQQLAWKKSGQWIFHETNSKKAYEKILFQWLEFQGDVPQITAKTGNVISVDDYEVTFLGSADIGHPWSKISVALVVLLLQDENLHLGLLVLQFPAPAYPTRGYWTVGDGEISGLIPYFETKMVELILPVTNKSYREWHRAERASEPRSDLAPIFAPYRLSFLANLANLFQRLRAGWRRFWRHPDHNQRPMKAPRLREYQISSKGWIEFLAYLDPSPLLPYSYDYDRKTPMEDTVENLSLYKDTVVFSIEDRDGHLAFSGDSSLSEKRETWRIVADLRSRNNKSVRLVYRNRTVPIGRRTLPQAIQKINETSALGGGPQSEEYLTKKTQGPSDDLSSTLVLPRA